MYNQVYKTYWFICIMYLVMTTLAKVGNISSPQKVPKVHRYVSNM